MTDRKRNAVDCIGPAFDAANKFMLRPFQWSRWWRVALIGMATAVIGTANGCNLGGLRDVKEAFNRDPNAAEMLNKLESYVPAHQLAAFITVLIVGALVLALVHIYVNSVARFMLFDALTTSAVRIRQGWNKWQGPGTKLFAFQIALSLFITAVLSALGYLFSVTMGSSRDKPGAVVLGFLAMAGSTWIFSIIVVSIHQISVDFVVPVMALERAGLRASLGKVWGMATAAPLDFFVYLLMKLLLVIGIGIALLIVEFMLLIIPLLVMIFVMALVIAAVAGSGSPALMVVLLTLAGAGCAFTILFMVAMIAAPTYVFFQAYALEFFSDRYPPLKAALHPQAPPPPPVQDLPPLPAM